MARRLRSALALAVAASLVVLSPGLEAPRLFAQVIGRAAPVQGVSAAAGASVVSAPAALPAFAPAALTPAPSLAAPSAFAAAPLPALAAAPVAAAPALAPAARAASVPEFAQALAPHLEALAKPDVTASGASAAGRGIEDAITSQRSAGSGDVSSVVGADFFGAPTPALGFSAAAAPAEAPKPGVPAAAAPAAVKTVDSEISYRVHRFLLKAVAALTGAVFTQPAAGPALTAKLIKSAAERTAVFSDYDDTLAAYNQVLPADMVSAVQAVKAAGKDFIVISDRGDEPRAHQLTVFESLASLPVETRAGMYVAANSGGRVYRYDEAGTPVRVFEAPALDEASKAKVAEAAEATKARLKEIGAEQHFPSAANNNPSESWGTYGYALMLKVGSTNDHVRGAADILQAELAKRGLDVEVNPRFAKDPANPPYINFSIVTKETSSAYIAKALKLEAKDVLVIGDSMYTPHEAKKASWLTRLGEKISGRALPQTGNRTDANMEKALPGALTLGVGANGDPRASNLWVLGGKGPSVTREVLMSVASTSRASLDARRAAIDEDLGVVGAAVIFAATAASFYAIGHAMVDWLQQAEQLLHGSGAVDPVLGAALGAGVLYGTARVAAKASLRASVSPQSPVEGFSSFVYAEALTAARAHAVELGYAPDNLRVTGARLSPRAWGEDWTFSFVAPREGYFKEPRTFELSVRRTMVSETLVDAYGLKDLGRSPLFVGFRAADLPGFVKVEPMDVVRKSGDAARTLELQARWTGHEGEPELWYVVRGDKDRELSAINAKTGAVDETRRWENFKSAAITISLIAATAGVYALLYWAVAHAPVAASSIEVPAGWQGPIPGNLDIGAIFGGTLGLGALTGTLRGVKKP